MVLTAYWLTWYKSQGYCELYRSYDSDDAYATEVETLWSDRPEAALNTLKRASDEASAALGVAVWAQYSEIGNVGFWHFWTKGN